jgi:hypothetical protein
MAKPARIRNLPTDERRRVRLFLFYAALLCVACAPMAWASGGGGKAKESHGETKPEREIGAPGVPSIDMPPLIAPVIVSGELAHYMHFGVSLKLTDDNHKTAVLKKVPYLQDAFLREVHGVSIALDNSPDVVDEKGLKARLIAVCVKVLGEGIVKDIEFRNVVRST